MNGAAADFVATSVFMLLGTSVSCGARLGRTLSGGMPFVAVAAGWGAALACGLFAAGRAGAHLNPAVTLALWSCDRVTGADAAWHVAAQCAGTALGMVLAVVAFVPQWARGGADELADALWVRPAVHAPLSNLLASAIATAAFTFVMLRILAGDPLGAGADTGADAGLLPATQAPFILGHMGESAVIAGIALFACIAGAGAAGAALHAPRAVVGRLLLVALPVEGKSSVAWTGLWEAVVGPALGAFAAAWAWRAAVS